MGDILCGLRRRQDAVRRTPARLVASRRAPVPRSICQRIPTRHARAPVVITHSLSYDGRCDQYDLHEPAMGYQDSIYGIFCMVLQIESVIIEFVSQTQSRSERRYRHTLDAAVTIFRNEGIRAFYRGLLPSLLGITHVAVQFPLYEKLKIIARAFKSSCTDIIVFIDISLPQCVKIGGNPSPHTQFFCARRSQR